MRGVDQVPAGRRMRAVSLDLDPRAHCVGMTMSRVLVGAQPARNFGIDRRAALDQRLNAPDGPPALKLLATFTDTATSTGDSSPVSEGHTTTRPTVPADHPVVT